MNRTIFWHWMLVHHSLLTSLLGILLVVFIALIGLAEWVRILREERSRKKQRERSGKPVSR